MPSENERIEKLEEKVEKIERHLSRNPIASGDAIAAKLMALDERVKALEEKLEK
jgi:polyhydroxyalkanoate synthesis regulator phasin